MTSTTPARETLNPCPFCGGIDLRITNRHIENAPGYGYTVFEIGHVPRLRMNCTATISAETQMEAVERWNRRTLARKPA